MHQPKFIFYSPYSINVASRPLDIRFTDYPKVAPKGVSFTVTVSLFDEALGAVADPAIGLPNNINCSLTLNNGSSLDGQTTGNIDSASEY